MNNRLITTYLNVLILLVLCHSGITSSYSNDISKFLDPVEQFQYENDDININRRFQKSVFNVPVRTEAPIVPCPPGTQRIESADGPCIPVGPTIKFGDSFLLQSFSVFNNNRRKILSTTTEPSIITSSKPAYHHGKRRRTTTTTTIRSTTELPTSTFKPTTPKYKEGPTYIVNDNEEVFRRFEPKPSVIEDDKDDTTPVGQAHVHGAPSRDKRLFEFVGNALSKAKNMITGTQNKQMGTLGGTIGVNLNRRPMIGGGGQMGGFGGNSESRYINDVSNLTVSDYLIEKAQEAASSGKGEWIIDVVTGASHRFDEFEVKSRKIASALYKQGMRKGDTAIYMTYDMVNIHIFFAGVWRANGIVRASYPEDDEYTLLGRVEESRAGWILCDPMHVKMCLSVASKIYWGVEVIVIGQVENCISFDELLSDDGDEMPQLKINSEDIALILCTSGTTGQAKGAVHTHTSLLFQLESVKNMPFQKNSKPNLIVSKGTHVTGVVVPLGGLVIGEIVLVMASITKDNVFKAVDEYKPGFIWAFPTFLMAIVNDPDSVKYDLSSLEIAGSGGAPITPAIEQTVMKLPNLKALINCYGLTEVVPVASEIDLVNPERSKFPDTPPFTVGKLFPGVTAQIRDLETRKPLGQDCDGEICVKSKSLFKCYYKNPKATREAFIDGWFLTGDVGHYDEKGFLFINDRIKEIFKYYNNHISPSELEDVIGKHDDVNEVCVIGIPDPNGGGSIPRAFVTLKAQAIGKTPAKEIKNFANEKLPDYKHLRGGLFIVSDLPKGKTGKVARQLVSKLSVHEND